MRKTKFVASLFVLSGCCLLVGGINLFEVYRFWSDGATGFMESSDPAIARAGRMKQFDALLVDVAYVTPAGRVTVPRKPLPASLVKRLSEGDTIAVRFLKSDPQRVKYDGEEPESPWVWLIVAGLFFATAMYGLRLARRELPDRAL